MIRQTVLAAMAFAFASAASAATLTATWDPAFPNPVGPFSTGLNTGVAFTVTFDDDNSNLLFDIAEQDSFSGIDLLSFPGDPGANFDLLLNVVAIPDVAADSGLLGNTGWIFGRTGSGTFTTIAPGAFTYDVSGVGQTGVVPLPAPVLLLLAGLGALGLVRTSGRPAPA